MLEGFVPIPYILEEVDLILLREEGSAETVDRCISPPLVVEPTFRIEMLEVSCVSFTTPEVKISNFKITPDCQNCQKQRLTLVRIAALTMAEVIALPAVVRDEGHCIVAG